MNLKEGVGSNSFEYCCLARKVSLFVLLLIISGGSTSETSGLVELAHVNSYSLQVLPEDLTL